MNDTTSIRSANPDTRSQKERVWSPPEVRTLVDAWAAELKIPEICQMLPGRDYNSIALKAFRIGLPRRRGSKKYAEIDPDEDLLEITPLDRGYRYLDFGYSEEEVRAVYAPTPKPNARKAYCANGCGTLCLFETKYQRWCDPCRKEMNQIVDDGL